MKFNLDPIFGPFKIYLDKFNKYKLIVLILFLFILYFSNNAYVISGDAVPTTLLPWAILEEHTITLDDFTGFIITHWENHYFVVLKQGHLVSFYPIVTAILALPFYIPAYVMIALSGRPIVDFSDSFIFTTGYCMKFASVTMAVLGAIVLYLLLKRIFGERWAFVLSLIYGVCTSTWTISSQSLWQHGPAELLIICCYYLVIRNIDQRNNINILGMGALSALAFFNRPTDAILLIPVLYYIVKEKCWLSIPAFIIVGAPFMYYNQYFFGSVLGGYSNAVTPDIFTVAAPAPAPVAVPVSVTPDAAASTPPGFDYGGYIGGIVGQFMDFILILVIYTPIALLAIPGIINALKQKKLTGIHKEIQMTFILSLLLYTVFFGLINFPSGWGYGSRYWVDAIPLVVLFIGWSRSDGILYKSAFICLALVSFIVQAYGAYIYLFIPT